MQRERHMMVEHEEAEQKPRDWREEGRIDTRVDAYCDDFIKMMTKFEFMQDGHLGRISVAKHCIKLASHQSGPVNCVPDRAGLKARESDKWRSIKC